MFRARERGAVLVFVILLLPILIGFVGLAIDASSIYAERQHMRTAVDAAAKAGAMQISRGLPATVVNAARNDASLNGYTHNVSGVTATVNTPPASGPHGGDSAYVEVILQKQVPTYFIKILYPQAVTVSTRAVAGPSASSQNYYCMISLDTGWTRNAFDTVQNAQISLPDCGIYVNSTFDKTQTGSFRAAPNSVITANDIQLVGSADINNNAVVTPLPAEGTPSIADPFAALTNLAVPIRDTANCSAQNRSYNQSDNGITLQPGVYCGGITVRDAPTIYFAAGTYYLIGGGLKQNNNSKLIGTGGVTFIVTGRDSPQYLRYDGVDIGGGGGQADRDATFTAPTTGVTAGILFYQDPSIVNYLNPSFFGGGGGSDIKLTGAIYFPSTEVQYAMPSTDPSAAGDYTMIFAKTLKFQGNARLNAISNPPWPLPGGPPPVVGGNGPVTLVE